MYDTLIAGGGRILSFHFVVHLQDDFFEDALTHC